MHEKTTAGVVRVHGATGAHVGDATPDVHDRLAALIDRHARPDLASLEEVRPKGVDDRPEALVRAALDHAAARQSVAHRALIPSANPGAAPR